MPRYGAVVCGSDQLWAPKNVLADYFTLTLFPDSLNRFSYAASFGVSRVPALLKGRYRKFLNRLSHISVREEQGKALAGVGKSYTGAFYRFALFGVAGTVI